MKNKLTLILSFLLCTSFSLSAQRYSQFQVEMGSMIEPRHFGLFGELKYNYKSFDFSVRYARGIKGAEQISFRNLHQSDFEPRIWTSENQWGKRESLELWLNFKPNRANFNPIFGIGYSFHRFGEINSKRYDRNLNITTSTYKKYPDKHKNFVYKIGYGFKNFRVYLEHHPLKIDGREIDELEGDTFLSVAYNIGLSKKQNSPDYVHYFKKIKKYKSVFIRIETGLVFSKMLHSTYTSSATKLFLEAKVKLNNTYTVGGSFTPGGSGFSFEGFDKGTFSVTKTDSIPLIFNYSQVNKKMSIVSFFIEKTKEYTNNSSFFYGLGLSAFFDIDRNGFYLQHYPSKIYTDIDNPTLSSSSHRIIYDPKKLISQNWNIGTSLRAGFRTGPFTNKLVLNLPFGKIPATIEFQTAIGLNLRKWWGEEEVHGSIF